VYKVTITVDDIDYDFGDWSNDQIIDFFCEDTGALIDGASWIIKRDKKKDAASAPKHPGE